MENDNDILKTDFEYLLLCYSININNDYRFFYDEFFEHILKDTNKLAEMLEYKKVVFRSNFYKHFVSNEWYLISSIILI